MTGHCLLAKHLFNIEVGADPTCPLCEQEDRDHFVLKCEALVGARLEVYRMPFLQLEDLAHVSLPSLLKFSLRTKRLQRNKQGDSSAH